MAAPGSVSLGPDLVCVAVGAAEDAAVRVAALACDGQRRVALVRSIFAADGSAPTPPNVLIRPLGHGVVAVALPCVRDPVHACLVDEWTLPASNGGQPTQTAQGVPLPEYLSQRGFVLRVTDDLGAAPEAQSAAAQSSHTVLMIAPNAFESNVQAACDNAFMAETAADARDSVRAAVLAEHAALYAALTSAGVRVRLFAGKDGAPDGCFCNNWYSLSRGALALYPMKCPNRAAERRPELVAWLKALPGAGRFLDLTAAEHATPPAALEGTGSLVFDHILGVAYATRSERCDTALAQRAAEFLGFQELHAFDATDAQGRPVYHTNVVMSVGTGFAIVCDEAVEDAAQRAALLTSLRRSRDVIQISRLQMGSMCANVLELRDGAGLPILALSQRAHDAFTPAQRAMLMRHVVRMVPVRIDTLEEVGGGSVRCCIGELFDA